MNQMFGQPTFFFTWMVLGVVFMVVGIVVFVVSKRLLSSEVRVRLIIMTISTFIMFLFVEAALRISGLTRNYSEARLGYYNFISHGSYRDTIHVWPKNEVHEIGDGTQFLYPRSTNSLGLSDKEWQLKKPDSVFRIIALGDSFTEGDGAPADSTWPRLLEQQLTQKGQSVEVFNAGVCGSDPFQELMLLKYKLTEYEPDLVIVTISMQDLLEDIAVKGGMERFDPKQGKGPRFFELIYAYSHIARLIYNRVLGYSWVLVRENSSEFIEQITEKNIPELFKEFSEVIPNKNIMFVLYPHQLQTEQGYVERLQQALYRNGKVRGIAIRDLRPCYLEYINDSGSPTDSFWWKNDGHHNSEGYMMMAHCISAELSDILPNKK
ncbi:MAG: hypothetical protein K9G41_01050 [Flavobacteriales bacterium]|nr:hypothetical protein [Flavobacteriales bacterium]